MRLRGNRYPQQAEEGPTKKVSRYSLYIIKGIHKISRSLILNKQTDVTDGRTDGRTFR